MEHATKKGVSTDYLRNPGIDSDNPGDALILLEKTPKWCIVFYNRHEAAYILTAG
jgi:hypothetical protein